MNQATQRPERLTDLIEIKHGFAFSSEFFGADGDYILLTPGNFAEAGGFRDLGSAQKRFSGPIPPSFILKKGAVLIAMTEQSPGLLGATIKVPESDVYLHNQRLGLLSVKNPARVCLNYLYHVFNAPHVRKEISASAAGTKVKHTSPTKLSAVEVFLPVLADQERTAHLLDEWDTAIQKTEQLIAAKEQHYSHELSRLISRGQHPHGHIGTFAEEVSARNRGGTPALLGDFHTESREPDTEQDPAKRLTVRLHLQGVEARPVRGTESDGATAYFRRRAGQLIYGKQNIFRGAIGIIPPELDGYASTQDLPAFDIADGIDPQWLYFWLSRKDFYTSLEALATGSGSKRLHPEEFFKVRIYTPDLATQTAIARYLNALREEIDLLGQSVAALKTQKRGLMQKLLTGQWRLPVQEETATA